MSWSDGASARLAPGLALRTEPTALVAGLIELLRDADGTVVEAAAWALGELGAVAVRRGDGTARHDDDGARRPARP